MGFSFIHTSDIHLGRPFSDLSVLSKKTELCNLACQKAFGKMIDAAVSKHVNFVLIAGDSFDNAEHDLSTKLLFIKNLEKLADNGIKSYIICGNHDPISSYKKYGSYFNFDKKYEGIINIAGVTTDESSVIFHYKDIVDIHALSFESSECSNPVNFLQKANNDIFNIGLIHCDLDKSDSKYAPCSKRDLRLLGYDYYALGHIHLPTLDGSNMVYSGSLQSRSRKETGVHGYYYIESDGKTVTRQEYFSADFVRFSSIDLDCSKYNNRKEVFEGIIEFLNMQLNDIELMLYEINLTGISASYNDLYGSLILEYMENYIQEEPEHAAVYRINNYTSPDINESELLEDDGIIGILAKSFSSSSEINIDEIYKSTSKIHSNIYQALGLNSELRNEIAAHIIENKEKILSQAEKEIKELCKEIFNNDLSNNNITK